MSDDQREPVTGRTGNGRYKRTLEGAEHDAECARLYDRGHTYRQVGEIMGVSESAAHRAVQRVLEATVREAGDALRETELRRLDAMYVAAMDVLEREHYTVSNGQIIRLHGEPLLDDAPVLQAIDRMLKIQQRRAKLLGLDAPTKIKAVITPQERDRASELIERVKALREQQRVNAEARGNG